MGLYVNVNLNSKEQVYLTNNKHEIILIEEIEDAIN